MKRLLCLFTLFVLLMGFPAVSALDVVTTTSVLWDPVSQIGGGCSTCGVHCGSNGLPSFAGRYSTWTSPEKCRCSEVT